MKARPTELVGAHQLEDGDWGSGWGREAVFGAWGVHTLAEKTPLLQSGTHAKHFLAQEQLEGVLDEMQWERLAAIEDDVFLAGGHACRPPAAAARPRRQLPAGDDHRVVAL